MRAGAGMLLAVQVPLLGQLRAGHMPKPASDEGVVAPEQTRPLIYPCMEQSWRKVAKTVQACLRAKRLPVLLLLLKGTCDSYSFPSLMQHLIHRDRGSKCTQVGP